MHTSSRLSKLSADYSSILNAEVGPTDGGPGSKRGSKDLKTTGVWPWDQAWLIVVSSGAVTGKTHVFPSVAVVTSDVSAAGDVGLISGALNIVHYDIIESTVSKVLVGVPDEEGT